MMLVYGKTLLSKLLAGLKIWDEFLWFKMTKGRMGVSDGGPSMSLNYQPIRVTNLSDGTQSSTMPGAWLYSSVVFY